ncbi:transporter [Gluconobacter oxydans]|uniref:TOBE domain-containing protein n=1 Tax=Gluconobacter thailandicus TaxID=257438 RepID=UPI0002998869|nr:TOBE domain-containing protein [Gluconobacter thailandicus]AFW01499.1 molybdenum-pterin-binding protein [Gluconobacter oxydans H24]ANQ42857.1 transporter [Gluconobacter oxydans]
MEFSARNQLKSQIVKGATTSHLTLDVNGTIMTSATTNEAADELELGVAKEAYAVIEASSVMIGVD